VEFVAKAPLVLFKNLPKADAEAKLKKLKDAGVRIDRWNWLSQSS